MSGAAAGRTEQVRAAAARVVARVVGDGVSLEAALPPARAALGGREGALLQELVYGTLRWQPRWAAVAARLMRRVPRGRDLEVAALVWVGLYELAELATPAPAAVAAAVDAARALGRGWAAGLVNAVLRRFLRERGALLAAVEADEVARLAHPRWWLQRLRRDWPAHWQALAVAGNRRPPLVVRVAGERAAWRARLAAAGVDALPHPYAPQALVLRRPLEVTRLPGWAEGALSVQDAAAQLAVPLLAARPGQRVLDACAAPGGKTGQLLQSVPGLEVVALEQDAVRAGRLRETLARLRVSAEVRVADAADPGCWWDGRPFHRILLDAPCTGSGVVRRHPDIKHLRRASDPAAMAARQRRLLDALWPLLAPGGILVYVTCSVFAEENHGWLGPWLAARPDARELPVRASWGRALPVGRQVLTGEAGMDGFYYARLRKEGAVPGGGS
ncbi:16S rRNA (cytosine(967)-C(5))-methyltransferase RsmB [Inmirania thermothiophila]|uniref:16S rRNA (cytosine(967)-C(5))-methyltransferase n=1 Tax=Inmirania thermothiophila TaxID=1750597 RepID=A0A3N1Y6U7_9GAMM|nr:16S rRNA (cytosine(967)-C(5))-methyltransferase RsmB [Inmirania thermothiophila]ROR34251.1 16S rRNA m(5)C-967 methyltransferase [Inmirania thermothiophila]